jgi:hypothetical protein
MDAAEIKAKAAAIASGAKKLREQMRKSPFLEVVAAVAIGFVAGLVLRASRRREE